MGEINDVVWYTKDRVGVKLVPQLRVGAYRAVFCTIAKGTEEHSPGDFYAAAAARAREVGRKKVNRVPNGC